MATGKKSSSGSVKLDFRKTDKGRRSQRFPEGEYKVKILKAERTTAQSGTAQIKLTCKVVEPEKFAGKGYTDYLQLTEAAMHRVGWLLDAAGIKWSQKIMTFPLDKLKGKTIGIALYDDTWKGKVKSKVSEYYDEETVDGILEGGTDDEDEDDEDIEDEEDDDDEDEDEDEDDDDEDEDDL